MEDKEELARRLANRVERAVKVLKILVGVAIAIFAVTAVYGILALTVISDKQTAVIGFIVLICCLVVMAAAVMSVLAYAYLTLNKLKKMK